MALLCLSEQRRSRDGEEKEGLVDDVAFAALEVDALESRIGVRAQTGGALEAGCGGAEGIVVVAGTESGEPCAHCLVWNL